jgi:hypothetical protein
MELQTKGFKMTNVLPPLLSVNINNGTVVSDITGDMEL